MFFLSRKTKTEPKVNLKKKLPKSFGSPFRVIATTFLIFLIAQFVAALLVSVVLGAIHPGYNVSNLLNNSAGAQFVFVLLAEGGAVGLVILTLRGRGLKLKNIGLARKPKWRDIKYAAAGFAIFYLLLIIVTVLIGVLVPSINTSAQQDVGFNILNSPLDRILALFALVLLPPLGEEPLMRGYLFSGLRSKWGFYSAAVVTSVLFGLAHLQTGRGSSVLWIAGIDTFLLSMVLVYLRDKTNALYAGMMVHGLNNLIAFSVHFHGILF